jgi:hypothetical protein
MKVLIDSWCGFGMHLLPRKPREIGRLCLIFIASPMCLPSSLCAQAKPPTSVKEDRGVRVPFIGCASDGQVGPQEAPKGGEKLVQIDASAAQRLAYYMSQGPPGVLAPRDWYCFGTYGSSGACLYVSPQRITPSDLFSTTWGGFTGPAVEAFQVYGGTSPGRFDVARVIARIFPAQQAFVQSVIKEGIEPAADFPFGPYPKDKLTIRGDSIVEYQTPPHLQGLGTTEILLRANDDPVTGVAILLGQEQPDLLVLGVRLPPDMNDLTSPIVRQIERENEPSLSKK